MTKIFQSILSLTGLFCLCFIFFLICPSMTFADEIQADSKVNIQDAVAEAIDDQIYTGSQINPQIALTHQGSPLREGEDYTVSYSQNTNSGTAVAIISGAGNYEGELEQTFRILPKELTSPTISSIGTQSYTGKEIRPSVTVKDGGKVLKNGSDYSLSYKNNTNLGTASVTITGTGNYSFSKTVTFKIAVLPTSSVWASSMKTTSVQINWKKVSNVSGYEIKIYHPATKKYVTAKTASSSADSLKISGLKTANDYKAEVRAYRTINGKKYYSSVKSKAFSTYFTTPTNPDLTTGIGKATVSWDKVSGASIYQVYMATSANGTYRWVGSVSSSTTYYTKTGLTGNKTYYFKVRAYKKVNGKKMYSAYTSPMKGKICKKSGNKKKDILNSATLRPMNTNNSKMDKQVKAILKKCTKPGMSTYDKVKACYDFIMKQAKYKNPKFKYSDATKYNKGVKYKKTKDGWITCRANNIFSKKYGVCNDYAAATVVLTRAIGLESYSITGRMNGGSHTWCEAKIGGKYYILDAQVDDKIGTRKKKNSYSYFCREPREFGRTYRYTTSRSSQIKGFGKFQCK